MAISLLSINRVVKRFGGLAAVNDVSFDVAHGAIFGIIGPNGAGKTTLFNVVAGALQPTSGRIVFAGEDVTGKPPFEMARRHVARTFQAIELFQDFSVLENVAAGYHTLGRSDIAGAMLGTRRQRKENETAVERARENLAFVGVAVDERMAARGLGYGHRRLLEIARALMLEPELLLLDEPAAGMNAVERIHLSALIQRIRDRGVTVVVIEHHMDVVMSICDVITVLSQGLKISEGSPSMVKNDAAVIEAYLGVPDEPELATH